MRTRWRLIAAVVSVPLLFLAYALYPPQPRVVVFPEGKTFAFTIVDDTDLATLERDRVVYDVLYEYGLRTTKTVWVFEPSEPEYSTNQGDSLQDVAYRDFIKELQERGFEIALHGVRGGSSGREDIIRGLEEFRRELGDYPRMHVNHSHNRDNVYWGANRWSFAPYRWGYSLFGRQSFSGDIPTSEHFWGDLLQRHVKYVNQFTYENIDLLAVSPEIPYRLPEKPYVNYWFPTADGHNLDKFEDLLSPENLDRLEHDGGVCLVYAHLGAGSFNDENGAKARFEDRIKDLASRNGWFVPASELLDYLQQQPGWSGEVSFRENVRLETLFLWTLAKEHSVDALGRKFK